VEKGHSDEAITLVDNALNLNDNSVHARLMKLKLSLNKKTPSELGIQVDEIIDIVTQNNHQSAA